MVHTSHNCTRCHLTLSFETSSGSNFCSLGFPFLFLWHASFSTVSARCSIPSARCFVWKANSSCVLLSICSDTTHQHAATSTEQNLAMSSAESVTRGALELPQSNFESTSNMFDCSIVCSTRQVNQHKLWLVLGLWPCVYLFTRDFPKQCQRAVRAWCNAGSKQRSPHSSLLR